MCDNGKKLDKILIISEKDTPRCIQQFLRNTTTITDENLEEYDINNISSVKETIRYGFISSKITKNDKILSGKCVKLANVQVVVWKNAQTKEFVIIFVDNDSYVIATDTPRHTVHINLSKRAAKDFKPVKHTRVANRRHITRRNTIRPCVKNIPKGDMKTQLKTDKSNNTKMDQKPQKPRILQSTKNLDLFLKNSIVKDKNFTDKYITAIFTTAKATNDEDISKIFISRHISHKNELNNFVNIMKDICPNIKYDKYEYIRRKIEKNNIPVDKIKSITIIRKKYVRIYVRKNSKTLPKFANNLVNKSSIKINGEQFISAKNLNIKLENIKLFTPKYQEKCQNIHENIGNDTIIKLDETLDKDEPEKCIQSSNEEQTSLSKVVTKKQPEIIAIQDSQKLYVNEKPNSNEKIMTINTFNKEESKLTSEEPIRFKQITSAPKPVANKAKVHNKPMIVNKDVVLSQIQETLKIVTKRLEKNTQIIKEIASKSNQFLVRGIKASLHKKELMNNNLPPKNKEPEISKESQKSKETSEISVISTLNQNKILKKMKHDRKLVTITPIKNYIADNKRKVGDNSIRSGNTQKHKKSSNISKPIEPVINSQYIVTKTSGKKSKLNKSIPVIETCGITPVKVIRPVPKVLPNSTSFSRLTEEDLVPFRSEYPRKDHLSKPNNHIDTFLHQLCSTNYLEPLIKCSDKNCKSCIMLAGSESKEKLDSNKMVPKNDKFDFKQYLNEPSTSYKSNCNLFPVTEIQISPKNNLNQSPNSGPKKSTPISTIYQAKPKQIANDISKNSNLNNKFIKKNNIVGPSNKIQKTIEQSISKNNGHQKIVQQITKSVEQTRNIAGKTSTNNRKIINPYNVKQNAKNLAPKILTPRKSHTSIKMAPNKSNPISNKRKVNISKDMQRELLFDQKYKIAKTVCEPLRASQNMLLDKLSHTDANSQSDIQQYLQVIEQKFLKTFSLPEDEKVNAYNALAQEINDMLSILSTENTREKQLKIIESLERLTNTNTGPYKSRSYEKVSNSMEKFKFTSHSLINLAPKLMLPEATSSEELKKKVTDNAQPTVCTESINFMKSLSAIMSKQTQIFPSVSETKKETLKKPVSILKISSSGKVTSAKKVRFGASDSEILKSDISVTFSSDDDDDEDYSTINEEDVINFTSEEDVTSKSLEFAGLIYFKSDTSYAFVENLAEISYVILVFHQISFIDDSLHSITKSDVPTELDIRIKDFDVTYSKSNFTFSSSTNIRTVTSSVNLNYTFSDTSSSNFDIDNSDYIPIEAKGSPNVIEFLDIMANLSFEPVPFREEIFYQSIISYIHTTYETEVCYPINIFHETEIHYVNNIQALVPKLGEQSKQLSELTGNINVHLCPRLVSLKSLKLHSQYLQMAYQLQKEKYDSLVNLRKTRSLDTMLPIQNIHSQTLVLNMHVQNYQQSQIDDGNLNSKCLEDKKEVTQAEDNCTVICNENEKNLRSYRSILIFLYIAIFSTILVCTPLVNYKCE